MAHVEAVRLALHTELSLACHEQLYHFFNCIKLLFFLNWQFLSLSPDSFSNWVLNCPRYFKARGRGTCAVIQAVFETVVLTVRRIFTLWNIVSTQVANLYLGCKCSFFR